MLQFQGEKELAAAPGEVWLKLTDCRFLVTCLPDLDKVTRVEPLEATCVLRPGFSFARGTLDLVVKIVDLVPDNSARYLLATKSLGASSNVEANWSIEPAANGCKLRWNVEIKSLGGLLKAVPQGLLRGAAQKVLDDAWASVERNLLAR